MTDDLDYLLRRADQEAILAIAALHPQAAAAHQEMSREYGRAARARLREPADVALSASRPSQPPPAGPPTPAG